MFSARQEAALRLPAGSRSPNTHTGNAQLIFTTHDTSLLDAEGLFRRDQIWFMEKGADQASSLIALSEYSPRKNEALERGYLMGRYGGIPFLDRSRGLLHHGFQKYASLLQNQSELLTRLPS